MTFKTDYSSEQKPKTFKRRRKTKIDIQSKRNKNETEQEVKLFHKCMFCEFTSKSLQRFKGGFQLLDMIITELKSHMTC